MKEFLDRCHLLDEEALIALWGSMDKESQDQIENYLWSAPKFIINGKRAWRRSATGPVDHGLSEDVKLIARRRAINKPNSEKGDAILERLRKIPTTGHKMAAENQTLPTFSEWVIEEDTRIPLDSRGPSLVIVLSKDGFDGLQRLEEIARKFYEETKVPTWIEEKNLEGERKYALCCSMHCFRTDELEAVEKSIKETLSGLKEKSEMFPLST